jgi:hypothetical protein
MGRVHDGAGALAGGCEGGGKGFPGVLLYKLCRGEIGEAVDGFEVGCFTLLIQAIMDGYLSLGI